MAQDRSDSPRSRRMPDRVLIVGLTLLVLVVAGIFVYRMSTRPAAPDLAGDRSPVDRAGEQLPGGSDPQPKFKSTRDELEQRGAGERPARPTPGLATGDAVTQLSDIMDNRRVASGQRVELKDVEVDSAGANSFWIKDGKDKVAVVGPPGMPPLRGGQRVSVSGHVVATGGEIRINATRVEPND